MSDTLMGTVKGPGEKPGEFVFITTDNDRARAGEFVYYRARAKGSERMIIGNITERRLARSLPDSFLADPATPPASIAAMIGLEGDAPELFEIVVSVIGYFDEELNDFANPRVPPMPGQAVYLAPSEMLARVLSPRRKG
ncbi:MAG TPA: ATP-binding protein, partial [Blastocatellia bacterium]